MTKLNKKQKERRALNFLNEFTKSQKLARRIYNLAKEDKEIVYLVSIKKNPLVKAGTTKDILNRFKKYATDNPAIEIIDVMEGTREDEKAMQKRIAEKFNTPLKRREFYKVPQEINKNLIRNQGFGFFA